MATITQETRFELDRHEMVCLADARGHVLSCVSGELWITLEGDTRDVVLRAGRDWHIDGDGPVVISSFEASTLRLCRRQPAGRPAGCVRRLLQSLRRWRFPPPAFSVQPIR